MGGVVAEDPGGGVGTAARVFGRAAAGAAACGSTAAGEAAPGVEVAGPPAVEAAPWGTREGVT